MLRFLIHVIGDIHQPLHASTFFSEKYPEGDRGGNLFMVQFQNKTVNWHSVWDSQFSEVEAIGGYPRHALTASDFEKLEQYA